MHAKLHRNDIKRFIEHASIQNVRDGIRITIEGVKDRCETTIRSESASALTSLCDGGVRYIKTAIKFNARFLPFLEIAAFTATHIEDFALGGVVVTTGRSLVIG